MLFHLVIKRGKENIAFSLKILMERKNVLCGAIEKEREKEGKKRYKRRLPPADISHFILNTILFSEFKSDYNSYALDTSFSFARVCSFRTNTRAR